MLFYYTAPSGQVTKMNINTCIEAQRFIEVLFDEMPRAHFFIIHRAGGNRGRAIRFVYQILDHKRNIIAEMKQSYF